MNVYHRGAQDGLLMGALLSLMFVLQSVGMYVPILGLVGTLLLLCVPVLAYICLHRAYREDGGRSHFSALWMHGIMMFLCGSLIMALVVFVYVRFISPTFIADQMSAVIEAYREIDNPTAQQMAQTMQRMVDNPGLLPTPIQMAFATLWTGGFFGAVTSMLIAAIIKYIVRR